MFCFFGGGEGECIILPPVSREGKVRAGYVSETFHETLQERYRAT